MYRSTAVGTRFVMGRPAAMRRLTLMELMSINGLSRNIKRPIDVELCALDSNLIEAKALFTFYA